MLLQVVKMSDEVTVSSLPHPISMFFLGIFAVAILFMWLEVSRSTKRKDKICSDMDILQKDLSEFKLDINFKLSKILYHFTPNLSSFSMAFSCRKHPLEFLFLLVF